MIIVGGKSSVIGGIQGACKIPIQGIDNNLQMKYPLAQRGVEGAGAVSISEAASEEAMKLKV